MDIERHTICENVLAFVRPIIGVLAGVSYWLLKRCLRNGLQAAIFGAGSLALQKTLTTNKEATMEKEIAISKEAKVEINLAAGKVIIEAIYDGAAADASVKVSVDSDYLLDKLAAKIPGQVDDAVIGLLKAALKAI